jgi:hypothetical protein
MSVDDSPPHWFDDPIYDNEEAKVGNKVVRGDDWRRLQALRANGVMGEMITVAGTTFHAEAVKRAKGCVALVREPTNVYDPNAVRVEIGGEHVGYVPRGTTVSPDAVAHVLKMGMLPKPHVWLLLEHAVPSGWKRRSPHPRGSNYIEIVAVVIRRAKRV